MLMSFYFCLLFLFAFYFIFTSGKTVFRILQFGNICKILTIKSGKRNPEQGQNWKKNRAREERHRVGKVILFF
jgi:hypothetical protein